MKKPNVCRELTGKEKKGIGELVRRSCVNYDNHYSECLLLGTQCPLLLKHYYNGKLCTYFKQSILPLDSVLEDSLQDKDGAIKKCTLCHAPFLSEGRRKYCSIYCSNVSKQKATKERVRKHRKQGGVL